MAARKPDSLVGPLGVWAYDTARSLDLSAAQVAAATHVHEATIRKIEGGSNRDPSQDLVYRMHQYFQQVAEQKGRTAPPPPDGWLDRKPQPPADLASAILALTAELGEWRREREELTAKVEGLEALVGRLTAQVAAASRGRSVPDGKAG